MAQATQTFDLAAINSKDGATYGFSLSGTKLTPGNKGKDNSYAYAKLTFDMPGDGTVALVVYQSSEASYDYAFISNLDTAVSKTYNTTQQNVKVDTKGLSGNKTITYTNVTKGTHFITICWRKDGSQKSGSDTLDIISLTATYELPVIITEFKGVTFNLSTLKLSTLSQVTVRAKGNNWADSPYSNSENYQGTGGLAAPTISSGEGGASLRIVDNNAEGITASYNIYLPDGTLKKSVTRSSADFEVGMGDGGGVTYYATALNASGVESEPSETAESSCFVAGTPVLMADGSFKMIEEIKVGDKVQSFNLKNNQYCEGTVTGVAVGSASRLAMVLFADSNYVVMAEAHPLYTSDGWHSITNKNGYPTLKTGDKVLGAYGYVEIVQLEVTEVDPVPVYSLSVSIGTEGAVYFAGTMPMAAATHSGGPL